MSEITFLGTGNAFCPSGRLHSLVLIDGDMLVDAPPTVIPQLRQHGISPDEITDLLSRIGMVTTHLGCLSVA